MIVRGGISILKWDASYYQNKKAYSKETNASKSVRPKSKQKSDFSENTQFKNAKGGNNGQNQNQNSEQKLNQNSNQNKQKFCQECNTTTHWTKHCFKLKKKIKSEIKETENNLTAIKNVETDSAACKDVLDDFGRFTSGESDSDDGFGSFNAFKAVDRNNAIINISGQNSHPLETNEQLYTVLNL